MSVLNKKPYAQKVIESLGQEDLKDLASAINGGGSTLLKSFINVSYPFSTDDKGASMEYVGRNQLDGATLNRFASVPVDYDASIEELVAGWLHISILIMD